MNSPRIALISATPLAIGPAAAAMRSAFPTGVVWNLLDDRLLADAQAEGGITERLASRMDRMIEAAIADGADGVLLTCSQYGGRAEARDAAVDGVAVLSAAVLLVASLESAAADSAERLGAAFSDAGRSPRLHTLVVPAAAKPLPQESLESALIAAIEEAGGERDLIVLAQFSLAPAAAAIAERFDAPVLDGPGAAARKLSSIVRDRR
jgi:Asp/Glu/hydantoin racemase